MTLSKNLSDPTVLGNYLEALLWLMLALALAIKAKVSPQNQRRLFLKAAILFVAFGASDVVEAQTGAWWKPPWLLVWKGGCIAGFALCWWKYHQMKRQGG